MRETMRPVYLYCGGETLKDFYIINDDARYFIWFCYVYTVTYVNYYDIAIRSIINRLVRFIACLE